MELLCWHKVRNITAFEKRNLLMLPLPLTGLHNRQVLEVHPTEMNFCSTGVMLAYALCNSSNDSNNVLSGIKNVLHHVNTEPQMTDAPSLPI